MKIAVYTYDPSLLIPAKNLANKLNLPYIDSPNKKYNFYLLLTENYLGIQKSDDKFKPLYIDFNSPKMQIRLREATTKKEILVKAFGLKKNNSACIIDTTAGLGRDSFILASLGFKVIMIERSPIIFALLQNGLIRAASHPKTYQITKRINLINDNAIEWLSKKELYDYIYLDPMFPERKKTALVKKEMQFFQELLGDDVDAVSLFDSALACANKRVVVKRPRLSAPLTELKPDFFLQGKTSRFDVYLKEKKI